MCLLFPEQSSRLRGCLNERKIILMSSRLIRVSTMKKTGIVTVHKYVYSIL